MSVGGGASAAALPAQVREGVEAFHSQGGVPALEESVEQLAELARVNSERLVEVRTLLEAQLTAEAAMRERYGDRWATHSASAHALNELRESLAGYEP